MIPVDQERALIVRCRFAHFIPRLGRSEETPLAFFVDLPTGPAVVGLPASHFEHLDADRQAVARLLIEILTAHADFEYPPRACNGLVRYGAWFPTRIERARETLALYERSS